MEPGMAKVRRRVHRSMKPSSQDEIKYIEGLGAHRGRGGQFTKEELLEQYVNAHKGSEHKHHQEGVAYVKKKLRDMRRKWRGK